MKQPDELLPNNYTISISGKMLVSLNEWEIVSEKYAQMRGKIDAVALITSSNTAMYTIVLCHNLYTRQLRVHIHE